MESIRIEGCVCVSFGVTRDGGIVRGWGRPRLRAVRKQVWPPCPGMASQLAAGSVSSSEPHAPVGCGPWAWAARSGVQEYHGASRTAAPSVGTCCLCRCRWLWCFWVSLCYSEALIKIRASFTPCRMRFHEQCLRTLVFLKEMDKKWAGFMLGCRER